MDAVFLELQIEIRVGETARTPMLLGNDITRLRRELGVDLAAPRAVLEGPARLGRLLDRRNVFPALVVAGAIAMM